MLDAIFSRSIASVPWTNSDTANGGWGYWPGESGPASMPRVTEQSASQLLAVYGSASLITDEVSTLPVDVVGSRRVTWVDNPSEGVDRVTFIGQVMWSLLLSGNAFVAYTGNMTNPSSVQVLDPIKCDIKTEGGRHRIYVAGERPVGFSVLHIPGRVRPGDVLGMSPVEYARQSIGLGLAAQKFGREFFDGEGNMPGVIEAPYQMQPETKRELAAQWRRKRRSGGRGLPGVLDMGATWKATGVTNEQAQFLATRQFTAAEIAGQLFLLDPSDLGIPVQGSTLTYGNLQQRDQRRMRVALMPWIRRIEPKLSLLLPENGRYRFDVDAHLRGNTKESYETLGVAVDKGFVSPAWASTEILGFPAEAREGLDVSPPTEGGAASA